MALHFGSLLNLLVAGIRIDNGFLTVQEVSGWGEVMHIGSRGLHRVDLAALSIHPDVDFHLVGEAFRAALVQLLSLADLVHLRIPLLFLVPVPPALSR